MLRLISHNTRLIIVRIIWECSVLSVKVEERDEEKLTATNILVTTAYLQKLKYAEQNIFYINTLNTYDVVERSVWANIISTRRFAC